MRRIPISIWILGLVSLFTDIASELIHSILPLYMVSDLHASMTMVGIVEGVAQAAMLFSKIIAGVLSDYFGKRKPLTLLGYSIAAFSKILFPLAKNVGVIFFAHVLDRIGKGIRGAPRDALIADLAPPKLRGLAFGLRQSLDTTGAFLGPLLAALLLYFSIGSLKTLMWAAVFPSAISIFLLIFYVKEPKKHAAKKSQHHFSMQQIATFPLRYWGLISIASLLSLARFSEAFLILKAQSLDLMLAAIPFIFMIMNVAYALSATPAGNLSDRIDRKIVLIIGLFLLIIANIILAFANSIEGLIVGIIFWGLHMGFSEGIFASLITDMVPSDLRGTAFGLFHFVCGIGMLFASIGGGILWDAYGPQFVFLIGACLVGLSSINLIFMNFSAKTM